MFERDGDREGRKGGSNLGGRYDTWLGRKTDSIERTDGGRRKYRAPRVDGG